MRVAVVLILCLSQVWTLPEVKSIGSRIIGGQPAYAGEFPYAAAIYKTTADGLYFCTGSILTREWVITAGQCVDGATSFTILIGTHKLDGDAASVEKVAADEYVLHPDYNSTTLENDIGLIKFRVPITMTIYIRQVYLPNSEMSSSAVGVTFGWGQTTDDDSALSNTLNYVTLFGVSDAECRLTYGGQISANMACFEGNYNEGTCFGDSGSPIVQRSSVGTMVIGIASFFSANGCESTDPSGYTKVYPYNDWITNVTSATPPMLKK